MNSTQTYSLRCTSLELAILCQALGARSLFGLPFSEFDKAEPSLEELARAKGQLQEKEYLVRQNGSLRVAAEIIPLLNPVVNPTACLSQGLLADLDATRHLAFYWQPPNLIQLQRSSGKPWQLERLSQVIESWPALTRFWSQPNGEESRRRKVVLPQSVFDLARTWLERRQEDEFARQMSAWRAPADFSSAFAETLSSPLAQAALCAFERVPEGWGLEGFAYLKGQNSWWRTRPCQRSGEPWLEISEVGSEDALERASALLKRMLHV